MNLCALTVCGLQVVGKKNINVYKQQWTNLKFLKEKNLGLTASLTEKVFTATNQRKDTERRDTELRCQVTVNSSRQNKIINRDSALCWLKTAAGSVVYCLRSALSQRSRQNHRRTARKRRHVSQKDGSMTTPRRELPYPSFLLSLTGAGLTDIRGWLETELCDWLLAKDDVSRLTGDIGGVGLLHSEWEREPEEAGEEGGVF